MARETQEVAYCDYGGCDRKCHPDGMQPTGWLLGEVVGRGSSVDLCPEHREEVQESIQGDADGA